jgi:hypothetical protein
MVYLGRIDDTLLEHVDKFTVEGIVTNILRSLLNLANDERGVDPGVLGDLVARHTKRLADNLDAGLLIVVGGLDSVQGLHATDERGAAAGDDALLDCCTGSVQGVRDSVLLLVHLDLRGTFTP